MANESDDRADWFLQKIESKLKMLVETPGIGRKRDELVPNLRSFPVGNYLIFTALSTKELKLFAFCMEQEISQVFLKFFQKMNKQIA
ncbi:MAG: type II toxin-antitoxin system RelE/ParE family toxin [Rhizonema sp. PD37]|nr:type II toxin-antitoxin system RelE/ParE family toxin [Rhizonema sp. PD37]